MCLSCVFLFVWICVAGLFICALRITSLVFLDYDWGLMVRLFVDFIDLLLLWVVSA